MPMNLITPIYAYSTELTHTEFQTRYEELSSDGYRLIHIDAFSNGIVTYYGGIWIRDGVSILTRSRHGMSSSEYQREYDDLRSRGYIVKSIGTSSAIIPGNSKFAAVWNDGSFRGYKTHHGMTSKELDSKTKEYGVLGYKIIQLSGYNVGDSSRYAAIWSAYEKSDIMVLNDLTSEEYQDRFDELKTKGYRIVYVNAHNVSGKVCFFGIWKSRDAYDPSARHNVDASDFFDICKEFELADKQLKCMSGYLDNKKQKFAAVWVPNSRNWHVTGVASPNLSPFDDDIELFMKEFTIPNASLAVSRNGKLLMARGYSWITSSETQTEPVSLFRIGSISKVITATAIAILAEKKKLSLCDKLVDLIDMPGEVKDSRVKEIRIKHLIYHVGGWNRNPPDATDEEPGSGMDPTDLDFEIASAYSTELPVTPQLVIRWVNEKYGKNKDGKLDFDPGRSTGGVYSNYGYFLLGQIIESVTGESYEHFVKSNIFEPLSIMRMRPGRSLLAHKHQGEVDYFSRLLSLEKSAITGEKNVMAQYSRNLENNTPNGGWLASAVDLVRFASCFDDPRECKILSESSVNQMTNPHEFGKAEGSKTSYYGYGWYVRMRNNRLQPSQGGTMTGTKSILAKLLDSNGNVLNASLIFNKYDGLEETVPKYDWNLFDKVVEMSEKINSWPQDDYWENFF